MHKSNEELAKECIDRLFHDCEYKYMVNASKVKLEKGTNNILINGGRSKIIATKTVKTVLNDRKSCKGCKAKSNFAAIVRNINTDRLNVIFFIKDKEGNFQPLTKDHVLPKARGGTDAFKNLQSMCVRCNSDKADNADLSRQQLQTGDMVVERAHYESLVEKQKDFAFTRKRIKRLLKKMPWWMKMFGIHKYIERDLKEPLSHRGYYNGTYNGDDE